MGKGEETRLAILQAGMEVAAAEGLEAITIGRLADRVAMSKSGLFAHFKSKEALQIGVLDYGRQAFVTSVIAPAMAAPRGLPRLRDLFGRWMDWNWSKEERGGCLFLAAAAEYDDREGPVRQAVVDIQKELVEFLVKSSALCVEEGHLRSDVEPRQLAFELFALVMAHHFHSRLLQDKKAKSRTLAGFERLLSSVQ